MKPAQNNILLELHVPDFEKVKTFTNVVEKLTLQPWGLKDFRTTDPFGYYLRFTSYHDILDNSNAVP